MRKRSHIFGLAGHRSLTFFCERFSARLSVCLRVLDLFNIHVFTLRAPEAGVGLARTCVSKDLGMDYVRISR